jgi:hypothetical protein
MDGPSVVILVLAHGLYIDSKKQIAFAGSRVLTRWAFGPYINGTQNFGR